jgi:membrane-associated phospholipid phosphatase
MFYFGLFYLLYDIHIWETLKLVIFCSGVSILITALINLKYKISAHMVGIGGMVGLLISLALLLKISLLVPLIGSILIAGLIGSSRIFLKEHKPSQIYSGFTIGLISQLFVFLLLENFNFY